MRVAHIGLAVLASAAVCNSLSTGAPRLSRRRALAGLGSAVFLGGARAPVFALDDLDDLAMPEGAAAPPPLSEAERVVLKLEAQKNSSDRVSREERLRLEQAKTKAEKGKTKQQKQDDLCEMLGRGC